MWRGRVSSNAGPRGGGAIEIHDLLRMFRATGSRLHRLETKELAGQKRWRNGFGGHSEGGGGGKGGGRNPLVPTARAVSTKTARDEPGAHRADVTTRRGAARAETTQVLRAQAQSGTRGNGTCSVPPRVPLDSFIFDEIFFQFYDPKILHCVVPNDPM